jgi:hypothetical protein
MKIYKCIKSFGSTGSNNVIFSSNNVIFSFNKGNLYRAYTKEEGDNIVGDDIIIDENNNRMPIKCIKDFQKYFIAKSGSFAFSKDNQDNVNHPSHYTWLKDKCGIEVIDITRHLDFDLGNAVKYLLRCGHKSEEGMSDKDKTIEDLKKAIWYINDKINTLNK